MRFEKFTLDVVNATTGPGAALTVEQLREKWVQIAGSFTASIDIEGTIDGTNWIKLFTGATAAALIDLPMTVAKMRTNVTSYGTGTPVVTLGALNAHAM